MGVLWCSRFVFFVTQPFSQSKLYLFLACDKKCQDLSLNNPGWDYFGDESRTVSGLKCQKWNEKTPHNHDQPALDHNFCRNPDSADGGVWCYTTDPNVEWEYCSQIDSCGDTCQDKSLNNPGWNYHGTHSKTRTGKKCQKWSEQHPHKHDQPAKNHNYCRNPDSKDGGVWCYTEDRNTRWEYCSQILGIILQKLLTLNRI